MGNSPSSRLNFSSNRKFAATFSRHKQKNNDIEYSQSTTSVQFQRDLGRHQQEEEEYEYLTKLTTFSTTILRLLKRRFDAIDQTIEKDGQVSIEEFAKVLEMDPNSILIRRFFKYMDKSSMGALSFRNFATALSSLSLEAPDEHKMKLSFFLYDINDDQQIDRDECTKMVKLALNEINMKLSSDQIEVIVNNTFRETDTNGDGVIDYDEYRTYCQKHPRILEPFRLDISNIIYDEQENRRGRRVSKVKTLRHWPSGAQAKNKMIRKLKKSVPEYMKRDKIEKVRSIHNAQDIMGLDEDKNDDLKHSKSKSCDDNDIRTKSPSLGHSNTDSTESESATDEEDTKYDVSTPRALRFAMSADSADRKRKKKEKYKNKGMKKKMKEPNVEDLSALGLNTSKPRTPPKTKEKPKIKQSDLDAINRLLN